MEQIIKKPIGINPSLNTFYYVNDFDNFFKFLNRDMIYQTQGISYPRSGHAILWHFIKKYFGRLDLMHSYGCVTDDPKYIWAKQHDHHHNFPKIPNVKYVIQYRNPVRSIVSNYYLSVKGCTDSHKRWMRFCTLHITEWKCFISKWVINNSLPNCLYVPYEKLLQNPHVVLNGLIKFMTENDAVDFEKLDKVIKKINPAPRNALRDFPYYDDRTFNNIEKILAPQIKKLCLPSWRDGV